MKKTLLAILLLLCFKNSQAQVAVGLKAGLNSANITGTMSSGPNNGGLPTLVTELPRVAGSPGPAGQTCLAG
jgi:hypothetical protein